MTRETVVGIYNGTVTWWNDTSIVQSNPHVKLPVQPIIVAARSDNSGTTKLFTSGLSSFSDAWNATPGTFDDGMSQDGKGKWGDGIISLWGRSTSGMVGVVYSYPYSIGYVSVSAAVTGNFSYVRLVNKAGQSLYKQTKLTLQLPRGFQSVEDSR